MPRDGRWDWIEGQRLMSLAETIVHEASRHLADEIERWPPALAWTDAAARARYQPLFAEGAAPPSQAALDLGFQLARLELQRDYDAIAYALRNDAPAALGDPHQALIARFLHQWLPEWLYELNERTQSQLGRARLLAALDAAATRLRRD